MFLNFLGPLITFKGPLHTSSEQSETHHRKPQLQRNETSEFSLFGVNIHNLSLSFHCAVKGEHGERGDVGKKGDKGEIGDPGPQGEQARSDF